MYIQYYSLTPLRFSASAYSTHEKLRAKNNKSLPIYTKNKNGIGMVHIHVAFAKRDGPLGKMEQLHVNLN
jgi:hypothetical protein